jgi:hypothetical protein
MENTMEVPQKANNRTAIYSAILLLGIQLKEVRLQQRHLHTYVYCSIIHNSQVMEIAKMSHY